VEKNSNCEARFGLLRYLRWELEGSMELLGRFEDEVAIKILKEKDDLECRT
jgi:hypothetical protein